MKQRRIFCKCCAFVMLIMVTVASSTVASSIPSDKNMFKADIKKKKKPKNKHYKQILDMIKVNNKNRRTYILDLAFGPSKKLNFICFNESLWNIIKNAQRSHRILFYALHIIFVCFYIRKQFFCLSLNFVNILLEIRQRFS